MRIVPDVFRTEEIVAVQTTEVQRPASPTMGGAIGELQTLQAVGNGEVLLFPADRAVGPEAGQPTIGAEPETPLCVRLDCIDERVRETIRL